MKKTVYSLIVFSLLLFSCSGGAGGTGAVPVGFPDSGSSETAADIPSADDVSIEVPSVGEETYAAGAEGESNASSETPTSGADSGDAGTADTAGTADSSSTDTSSTDTSQTAVSSDGQSDTSAGSSTTSSGDTSAAQDEVAYDDSADTGDAEDAAIAEGDEANNFNFASINNVPAKITFTDKTSGVKIEGVEITVYSNSDSSVIGHAFSDSKGLADFFIQYDGGISSVEIVIYKNGYTPASGYFISVDNLGMFAEIIRDVQLSFSGEGAKISDRDGDGVADERDVLPDDKNISAVEKFAYVLAFEDSYPAKANADFNDAVIRYEIDQYISSVNKISRITVRTQVLAAGTSKKDSFGVYIAGVKHDLIEDIKADLSQKWNTRKNDKYAPGKINEKVITFKTPISRNEAGPVPFDPFLVPSGAKHNKKFSVNEIHLTCVKTNYKRKRFTSGGLAWGLLLPAGWIWPMERSGGIFYAYPDFEKWYKSAGAENKEWYLERSNDGIFAEALQSSSVSGYLFAYGKTGIFFIVAAMIVLTAAAVSVRLYRSRRSQ